MLNEGESAAGKQATAGKRLVQIRTDHTGHTGDGGRVTAQRSVTSAEGFSVHPTTKLDGDQRIAMKFSLTPRGKPWGEKRMFLKLRQGVARQCRAGQGGARQGLARLIPNIRQSRLSGEMEATHTGPGRARQGRARLGKARQGKAII